MSSALRAGAVLLVLAFSGCGTELAADSPGPDLAEQLGLGNVVKGAAATLVAGEVVEGPDSPVPGAPVSASGAKDDNAPASTQSRAADQPPADASVTPDSQAAEPPAIDPEAEGENAVDEGSDSPDVDGDPSDPNEPPPDPDPDETTIINGVYVLNLEGLSEPALAPYLNNPDVDGFSLRAGWDEVEPAEGDYDWSLFDVVIPYAASHDKKIMLRVIPGIRTPEWVYGAGAEPFDFTDDNPEHPTYGQAVTMPLPWDPVFLAKWSDLVGVLGARYANEPAVRIVAMTGPATGGEMHLGDRTNADRWHALGYSNALLVATWEQVIDAFTAAFPDQVRTVAICSPVNFDNPHQVVEAVLAYANPDYNGAQGNWLAAKTQPGSWQYSVVANQAALAPIGFQMLCSALQEDRFGGPLLTAIDLGLDAGASFLEIYKPDIAAFPDEIAYAHEQLTSLQH